MHSLERSTPFSVSVSPSAAYCLHCLFLTRSLPCSRSDRESHTPRCILRDAAANAFAQLATCIVGGAVSSSDSAIAWVQTQYVSFVPLTSEPSINNRFHYSSWSFFIPLFGTLINLGFLYWKRHSHPLNLVLLSTFTLMEAFTLGVMVAFFNNLIVLQAL